MNQKPTFLGQSNPLLCCMIQTHDPEEAIVTARNAAFDGADAYGFQYCKIEHEHRTEDKIKRVFRHMENKPIYVTNYRGSRNKDVLNDDDLGEGLVTLVKWGATLCDVMGDLYAQHPMELTEDTTAIEKQRRLIDRIHEAGGRGADVLPRVEIHPRRGGTAHCPRAGAPRCRHCKDRHRRQF